MARKAKVKLKSVLVRVDIKLLKAFDKRCRADKITREGAIRAAMERATKVKSIRRPASSLSHADTGSVDKPVE